MKLALNCARVAGTEILDRAAAKGLARVLDLPGPAARCWAAGRVRGRTRARASSRAWATAAQDGRIAHSLAADRVAAEVERCAELLGRPLDAALLHGPRRSRDERRRVVEAAAAAARATGGARRWASTRDAAR